MQRGSFGGFAPLDYNVGAGLNGVEMLERLKRERRHIDIPIVMLTTEAQPGVIDRAKKAGARGWIVKPFKADLMVSAVQNLLSRAR